MLLNDRIGRRRGAASGPKNSLSERSLTSMASTCHNALCCGTKSASETPPTSCFVSKLWRGSSPPSLVDLGVFLWKTDFHESCQSIDGCLGVGSLGFNRQLSPLGRPQR